MNHLGRGFAAGAIVALMLCSVAAAESPTRVSLPTFGIALNLPGAWVKQPEKHGGVVTRWAPKDSDAENNFFEIVALPLNGKTAGQRAEQDAQRWGGKVLQGTIGGRRAYLMRVPDELFVAVYVARGDILYSIGHRNEKGDAKELETILSNWQWLEAESPAKHLELDPARVTAYDRLTLQLPSWMRPEKLDAGELMFAGYSHVGGRVQSQVHVVVMPPEESNEPLEQLAATLGGAMAQIGKLPAPVAFKPLDERGDRLLSDPAKSEHTMLIKMTRLAVVALDARTKVTLRLHVFATRQEDQDAYAQLLEKIVSSIQPVAPTAPAK